MVPDADSQLGCLAPLVHLPTPALGRCCITVPRSTPFSCDTPTAADREAALAGRGAPTLERHLRFHWLGCSDRPRQCHLRDGHRAPCSADRALGSWERPGLLMAEVCDPSISRMAGLGVCRGLTSACSWQGRALSAAAAALYTDLEVARRLPRAPSQLMRNSLGC